MKSFKEIIQEDFYGNKKKIKRFVLEEEGKLSLGRFDGIQFNANHSTTHNFYKRLERANIKLKEFTLIIPKIVEMLNDNSFKSGAYAIRVYKDNEPYFNFVMMYANKTKIAYISTILTAQMKMKRYDFFKQIYEWLEENYNIHIIEKNTAYVINHIVDGEEKGMVIENCDGNFNFLGENFYYMEVNI